MLFKSIYMSNEMMNCIEQIYSKVAVTDLENKIMGTLYKGTIICR